MMDVSPEVLRAYAAAPIEEARRLRAVWSAAARAATPRGLPFPLRSWPPDAAIDIQALAEAVDKDLAALNAHANAWNANDITNRPASWSKVALTGSTISDPTGYTLTGGHLVVQKAGTYTADWALSMNAAVIARIISGISLNGAQPTNQDWGSHVSSANGFGGSLGSTGSQTVTLAAGAKVELWGFHDPAGSTIVGGQARLTLTHIHN